MASFTLPEMPETPGIWGPPSVQAASSSKTSTVLPPEFADIPFAPFSKSDKIGRIADWNVSSGRDGDDRSVTGAAAGRGARMGGRRDAPQAYGSGSSNAFAYFHGDDEATFSVVDNTRTAGAKRGGLTAMGRGGAGRGGGRGGAAGGAGAGRGGMAAGGRGAVGAQRGRVPARGGPGGAGGPGIGRGGAAGGARRGGYRDWDKPQRTRDPSVTVGPDWEQLEVIDFVRLGKLRLEVPQPEDLGSYGTLHEYDRAYDRIASVRFEKPLQPLDRVRYNPTSSDDPVLADIASKAAVATEEGSAAPTRLFVTDSVLALLMCTTRVVYPWDMLITTNEDGDVFFDKRDGGAFDYVTVNENAADPPMEADKDDKNSAANINNPGNLSLEATYINQNFAFQVVNPKKTHNLTDGGNPFHDASQGDADQLASSGFRYRKFDLTSSSDDPVELYVRTELDAYVPSTVKNAPPQFITIRTLNEFDSRAQGAGGSQDWRTKLDAQRGAVVANEMKNNAGKLARWAIQSLLAGADNIKMGYISRTTPKDSSRHSILATQWFKPADFAAQINVNVNNGWGIVRTIADLARKNSTKGEKAKFVLAKDPNKGTVRLYRVPLSWPSEEGDELDDLDGQDEIHLGQDGQDDL
ncbi:unnamed protein product [Sympodiomycopsis kandeliae]